MAEIQRKKCNLGLCHRIFKSTPILSAKIDNRIITTLLDLDLDFRNAQESGYIVRQPLRLGFRCQRWPPHCLRCKNQCNPPIKFNLRKCHATNLVKDFGKLKEFMIHSKVIFLAIWVYYLKQATSNFSAALASLYLPLCEKL